MTNSILDRFLRYVQIDTQSNEHSETTPSTPGQWNLLKLLFTELQEMALANVRLTEHGYVIASIPSNVSHDVPAIAFFAHVDTAQDFSGKDVNPQVHAKYSGGEIRYPDNPELVLNHENAPQLKDHIGHTIVTAGGTTLLGADDKAGVAIIMSFVDHLINHPDLPHGPLRICFNPDEEIGRGVSQLQLGELNAQFAYTLDAEELGQIQYESFSAEKAVVTITGVAIHPGRAKGQLVNAIRIAGEFLALLPEELRPETTEEREGFLHPYQITGDAAKIQLSILLRDFEDEKLATQQEILLKICLDLEQKFPGSSLSCEVHEQYRNMRYVLEKDMRPVELAKKAIQQSGLEVIDTPIRGGTDGSLLTAKGLPTPNIFCGFHNAHGPLEWVALEDMEQSVRVLTHLVQNWVHSAK